MLSNKKLLFDDINQRNPRLGRPEVMLGLMPDLLTARAALIARMVKIYVAETESGFQIPTAGEKPLVTVREANPVTITLKAVIFQIRGRYPTASSHHLHYKRRITSWHPENAVKGLVNPVT